MGTKNRHENQNSKKVKGPEKPTQKQHLDQYPVQPVILFSIALTLFGLLQIVLARKISNNSETLSCDDKEEEEDDKNFIIVNSNSDENFKNPNIIILKNKNTDRPMSSLDKIDEEPLNV